MINPQARLGRDQVTPGHLQRWARTAHNEIKPRRNLRGRNYFTNLRRSLRISSRKITRFVANSAIINEETTVVNATVFLHEINDITAPLGLTDGCVWNADQSRFQYELIRNRTLTFNGEKIVEARVVAAHDISHSYTIQVHMSKAGVLGSHIFICFQEKDGVFGPRVQPAVDNVLQSCSNVRVAASTSGKFTKRIMQDWFSEVFLQDVSDQSILILDAWSGQGPGASLSSPNVLISYIPEGATKYVQPLDVYFFRQYKLLVKNVVEVCRELYLGGQCRIKPGNRYFIIRLHSVCFNQLSHPRFSRMWRYAWRKPGYTVDGESQPFENVIQILLSPLNSPAAICSVHNMNPIFKCVYCAAYICHSCLLDPIHLHLTD